MKEQSVGLVLVTSGVREPLEALLKAYEARLKPLETMEDRWKHYPNPAIESRYLEIYKQLIETLQSIEKHTKKMANKKEMHNEERNPVQ